MVLVALFLFALIERGARREVQHNGQVFTGLRAEGRDHLPVTSTQLLAAFAPLSLVKQRLHVGDAVVDVRTPTTLTPIQAQILQRLQWNILLSEALYPVPATLEVTLRNSIHTAFSQVCGRQDWYGSARGQFRLEPRQRQEILDAKATHHRACRPLSHGVPGRSRAGPHHPPPDHDRVNVTDESARGMAAPVCRRMPHGDA